MGATRYSLCGKALACGVNVQVVKDLLAVVARMAVNAKYDYTY